MGITYYDQESESVRIKRRYVWAVCGFAAGLATGLLFKLI